MEGLCGCGWWGCDMLVCVVLGGCVAEYLCQEAETENSLIGDWGYLFGGGYDDQ